MWNNLNVPSTPNILQELKLIVSLQTFTWIFNPAAANGNKNPSDLSCVLADVMLRAKGKGIQILLCRDLAHMALLQENVLAGRILEEHFDAVTFNSKLTWKI